MKPLFYVLLSILTVGFAACGGQTGDAGETAGDSATVTDQLQSEVMAIHDEVMPKTGRINELSRELRAYLENHPDLEESTQKTVNETVASLEAAEEAMMDWMAAYGGLTRQMQEMDSAEVVKALENEKKKISEVRDKMLSSIEAAEQLSANLEKEG